MLGVAVLVVAVVALRDSGTHTVGGGKASTVIVTTSPKVSSRPVRSTSPAGRTGSSTAPSTTSSSPKTASATTRTSTTPTGAKAIPLVILNNTTTQGLAKQAAQRFGSGGWTVTRYGNLPGDITDVISTCAYYDPSVGGAKAAAESLHQQYPVIKRVKAKFSGLPAGPIVVVLTTGYESG